MKGEVLLSKAKKIFSQLSKYPNNLSLSKRNEMYWEYFKLLRCSAYLGNPEGQYDYAQQFDSISLLGGNNPLYNVNKCIYWYTKSATSGFSEAYNNLAGFYEEGLGVKKDLLLSYELYKKAAELGSYLGKKNSRLMEKYLKKQGLIN
ncbi:tetratricopeptide repeat protein [Sphingobacterium endophyticum]|uniref:tetratricopeptide repeat protein n=1 Tax=Sphingobacterium endophyticum TaxID=2546448 RepID=UPI0018CF0D60|nr:SEL1-like repeat protein [Sphingobacterium endophyticum]